MFSKINLKHLLISALVLHLTIAVAINVIGKLRLLPDTFDTNGISIGFARDSKFYRQEIVDLVETFSQRGIGAWLAAESPLHVKLYSLCFAIFRPLFGLTTLSAEPLNVSYYLLILLLVFAVGREVFDRKVGLVAAGIVALWPSFLLHTTQLLRDPLFIVLMLGLVFVCTIWLTRVFPPLQGFVLGMAGAAIVCLIWILRKQMWEVVLAIALFATILLVIRQIRERRLLVGNLLGVAVILIITAGAPRVAETFKLHSFSIDEDSQVAKPIEADRSANSALADSPDAKVIKPPLAPGAGLQARITHIRHRFIEHYPDAGSSIDTDVVFASKADIVRYLPRAVVIGLFSPFPNMWFVEGAQVGIKGRMLSGLETALMYLVEILAAFGFWHRRQQLTSWLLLSIVGAGLTALGLVLVNIAVIYRMRYVFWILLIIFSVHGARHIFPKLSLKRTSAVD